MSDLTILCVTRGQPYAHDFLTRMRALSDELDATLQIVSDRAHLKRHDIRGHERYLPILKVTSTNGCIEDVLDQAIGACPDGYILRLDDDETLDAEAVDWLKAGGYREHDHWAFRRKNLYPDAEHYVTNPPLWPDLQTRLSTKEKSGGRTEVHVGSPFGTGTVAPGSIHHHKFLVRTRAEREALVEHYERIREGAGRNYAMFSVPDRFEDRLKTKAVTE